MTAEPIRNNDERLQKRRRFGLIVFSACYTFLFAGSFLGWGPMQLLLEKNGSFSSKCTMAEQEAGFVCPEQTSALVSVQFYALASQVASPILGQIGDHYGSKALIYLMTATCWTALALFLVAAQLVDVLLYPTFILLGLVAWMGAIMILNTGFLFTGHTMSRAILILNSLFDAGSVSYLGLQAIGDGTGATLTELIGGYFVLSVVIFGGACYFWTVVQPDHSITEMQADEHPHEGAEALILESDPTKKTPSEGGTASGEANTCGDNGDNTPEQQNDLVNPAGEALWNADGEKVICVENDARDSVKPDESEESNGDGGAFSGHENPEMSYVLISERADLKQLTSTPFILLALFFTIHSTSQQWSMATTRDFLAFLGDDEFDNKYLQIFTLLLPASLLATPFSDGILKYFGFHGGLQMINALALGYLLVRLCSDNLNVQVFGFVLFSLYRSFLYGITFSFMPALLATNVCGKASGILMAIAGVLIFVNVPLSNFAIEARNGDFFIPNLIYTILTLPCFVVSWFIGIAVKRENVVKMSRRN